MAQKAPESKDEKVAETQPLTSALGFIFHWGPYAVPAFDDPRSARRRKTQNGSEWYLGRLLSRDRDFRPPSGTRETVAYHDEHYAGQTYEHFAKHFCAEHWDPDAWMRLCKAAGARYVILTARHHDGYCLWPSEAVPPKNTLDLLQEFKEAALRAGLAWGIYYSWFEWGRTVTKDYLAERVGPQIDELIAYQPQIWFFDGHWMLKSKHAVAFAATCCHRIKHACPTALINDRVGEANIETCSDYRVWADRHLPDAAPDEPWIHINTIGLSWGYNAAQESSDYKTLEQWRELDRQVVALGGGRLLNLGPRSDGTLDPTEEALVRALGEGAK